MGSEEGPLSLPHHGCELLLGAVATKHVITSALPQEPSGGALHCLCSPWILFGFGDSQGNLSFCRLSSKLGT